MGSKLHGHGVWAWTLKSAPPGPWAPISFLVLVKKFQTHTIVSEVGEGFHRDICLESVMPLAGWSQFGSHPDRLSGLRLEGKKAVAKEKKSEKGCDNRKGVGELCPCAACCPNNLDTRVALAKDVQSPACAAEMRGL